MSTTKKSTTGLTARGTIFSLLSMATGEWRAEMIAASMASIVLSAAAGPRSREAGPYDEA